MGVYGTFPTDGPTEEDYEFWRQQEEEEGEDPLEGAVDPMGYDDETQYYNLEDIEAND